MKELLLQILQNPNEYITYTVKPQNMAGQTVGNMHPIIILECEALQIKIEMGYHRSQLANKLAAQEMFIAICQKWEVFDREYLFNQPMKP